MAKIPCSAVEKYANMVHVNFVCKVPFPHGINTEKVWKEGRIFDIYISILFKLINMNTHIVYFKNKYYYCNILQGEETYAVSLSYYFYSISIETGRIETPRIIRVSGHE